MTSLPEQLSAARKQQLDAQFQLFRSFATQALDNAGRLVNLNLTASRESVERSSRAMRQMLGATDPRELAALRTHAEEQVRSLVSYGQQLFSIATSAQPQAARTLAAAAPAVLPAPAAVQQVVEDSVDAGVALAEQATGAASSAVDQGAASVQQTAEAAAQASDPIAALVQEQALKDEPAVVQAAAVIDEPAPAPAPVSTPKPVAKVLDKGEPQAAVAPHPAAAPLVQDARATASVAPRGATPSKRKK